MKYILLLSTVFVFSQCTKKVASNMDTPKTTAVKEAFRSKAPGAAAARTINLGDYNSFTLDNGLKVIIVENHKLPRVSYQISLDHESILEGEEAGYVSIAGSMLSRGTKNRTKSQLDAEIDFIGANLSTSGRGMFATSLKKHSNKLLELMSDVLYNPIFPKEEFEKVKAQTLSGLATQKTDANAISGNVSSAVLYSKLHPYGEVQTEKTTKAIKLETCKKYVDTYFKANNAYLVIVGDITPAEAKEQATKYFSNWKKGDIPTTSIPEVVVPNAPKVIFANKDGAVQSVINVTYPVMMKPGAPDEIATSMMNNILGGGIFSGRLMQNLREKKAYTYGARSSISSDRLIGNFEAGASVRNIVTDSSVQEILYEMERIVKEPVAESDINLVKNSMSGSFARSLESPQTIANFALNTFRYNLPKDYYNTYLSKIEKLTIADLSEAAKKYVKPSNAYIVVVGNREDVAKKLLRFDGDKKIDYYDAYGELLKDNIGIPAGVTVSTIIEDNLAASGGKSKLESVKSLITESAFSAMGQNATAIMKQKGGMSAQKVTMAGMVVMDQKFDGKVLKSSQMGGEMKEETSGPQFMIVKNQKLFDQLELLNPESKKELVGVEEVDGVQCYKVAIVSTSGISTTLFFDAKTSLLKRKTQSTGAQGPTISFDYSDYKEVNGIMLAHIQSVSGAMPVPVVMNITKYVVDSDIPDSEFK
jgi:zinc protease